MLQTILLVAALVLFILSAAGINHPRVNLMAAGLACWVGALLAGRSRGLMPWPPKQPPRSRNRRRPRHPGRGLCRHRSTIPRFAISATRA